jgi:Xaa-Pro aminopeptidase
MGSAPGHGGIRMHLTSTASETRLAALVDVMRAAAVAHAVIGPGSDLRYLTGYHALAMERPTLLLVDADGGATLVAPRLEEPRARSELASGRIGLRTYGELDDPFDLAAGLVGALGVGTVGVGDQLWSSFTLALQARLPGVEWTSASALVGGLRVVKDSAEVAALAEVGRAIDAVHARVPDVLRSGRTEREVARDLAGMIRASHDEVSFVIVAGGPNAASAHHEPNDRVLTDGDVVVVDIGGVLDGYCSDMTRTYALGSAPAGFDAKYAALLQAQQAATALVRPGVTAGAVDAAARDVLTAVGLGEAFVHRTGHGIGLDTHETPWIVAGSEVVLAPGMAFSVEPGFYVEGWAGARIEDIVTVTGDGVRSLNVHDRDLVVLR